MKKMKMPYYLAYPMCSIEEEKEMSKDARYMKCMYPEAAKRLLPYVEEFCENIEDSHHMIYDECPDQLTIRHMGRKIFEQLENYEDAKETYDMIQVLLCQEICEKRREKRCVDKRRTLDEEKYYSDRNASGW